MTIAPPATDAIPQSSKIQKFDDGSFPFRKSRETLFNQKLFTLSKIPCLGSISKEIFQMNIALFYSRALLVINYFSKMVLIFFSSKILELKKRKITVNSAFYCITFGKAIEKGKQEAPSDLGTSEIFFFPFVKVGVKSFKRASEQKIPDRKKWESKNYNCNKEPSP